MAQTILIKRGLATNLTFTPLEGEFIWTTDTKRIVMGDGTTVGGIDLFASIESSVAGNALDITTNSGNITTNTTDISGLDTRLTTAEGTISTNTTDIGTVNTRIDNLSTTDIAEGTNLYYTDVRSDARIQTAIDDTSTSTTTLWSSDKISSVIVSGVSYQGHWDASNNTPSLVDGTGTNGDFYICDTAGTVDFSVAQDGSHNLTFVAGDHVIFTDDDGAGPTPGVWEKSINSNEVQSVNGLLGAVILGGADLLATGYSKAATAASILVTDSLNEAIGKLEKGIEDAQAGGEVNVQADWTNTTPGDDAFILNKPTDVTDLTQHTLDELSDITITSIQTDDYLSWDGSAFINKARASTAFDDLTDVDTTTVAPVSTDLIQFDGTNWTPVAANNVGRTTFTTLNDTPANYTGSAGYNVQVNAGGTALEFVDTSTIDGGAF